MLPALLAPLALPFVKGLLSSVVSPIANGLMNSIASPRANSSAASPIANAFSGLMGRLAEKGTEKAENQIQHILFDTSKNSNTSRISY